MVKILIVDDEMDILDSLKKALVRTGFKEVTTVNNPKIALEIVKIVKFDVLITDIEMRGLNGVSLIKKVLEIDREVKIIIMTVIENFKVDDNVMNKKILSYFDKPIDLFKLVDLLNSIDNNLAKVK